MTFRLFRGRKKPSLPPPPPAPGAAPPPNSLQDAPSELDEKAQPSNLPKTDEVEGPGESAPPIPDPNALHTDDIPMPPPPSEEAITDYKEHIDHIQEEGSHLEKAALSESSMPPPPPELQLLEDKPYEVELVRLPGESPQDELHSSLKSAHNLIKAKAFDQAGMLYDIIDVQFKKHVKDLDKDTKRLYNEVTLYLWIHDAYLLSQKRHLHKLANLLGIINKLMTKVAEDGPIDIKPFLSARSQLSFIEAVMRDRK